MSNDEVEGDTNISTCEKAIGQSLRRRVTLTFYCKDKKDSNYVDDRAVEVRILIR
jgi:hypothetical protein